MALGDLHPDGRPADRTGCALLLAKGTVRNLVLNMYEGHVSDPAHKHTIQQNAAARDLSSTKIGEHITPFIRALLWLPSSQRNNFNILLFRYKAPNGLGIHV